MRETELDLDVLAQTESVFALSNGHIGLRGNLDEGEPNGLPGTYLNSFYELRPLPYAEAGYGYPESGQTIVNVTDGKIIRLLVDDEPFDVRYGKLLAHERVLDLRAGTLRAPRGVDVARGRLGARALDAARLVRAARGRRDPLRGRADRRPAARRRAVGAGRERAGLADADVRSARRGGARGAAQVRGPLRPRAPAPCCCTRRSAASCGWAPRWITSSTGPTEPTSSPRAARTSAASRSPPTSRTASCLRVVKFLAYGWSSQRSFPAIRDQVVAALSEARHTGWDGLLAAPARSTSTSSGSARTSSSRATPSCSRRCASASSTRCRPARAPSSARSRRRA